MPLYRPQSNVKKRNQYLVSVALCQALYYCTMACHVCCILGMEYFSLYLTTEEAGALVSGRGEIQIDSDLLYSMLG